MADQEHLDILRQGVELWNEWRTQHPNIQPDLSKVNLMGADLSGANLAGAEMSYANFSKPYQEDKVAYELEKFSKSIDFGDFLNFLGANLSGANLSGANLTGANLRGAILVQADLSYARLAIAKLRYAILSGANLRGARLEHTNLLAADLIEADLSEADLFEANLRYADLERANLAGARFKLTGLDNANFSHANLEGTAIGWELREVNLSYANLRGARLRGVKARDSNFTEADLSGADLSGADLSGTILVRTNLTNATLKDCNIYGISAWDVRLDGADQFNLTVTPNGQPAITVDNLKVAQFIYLLLNNVEIRDVINTLTTKAVLILGRFTAERKAILDAIRDELRKLDYLPILFDFETPSSQTVREMVSTLARLSYFIIADLTDPSSIPLELETIVPGLAIPVQPVIDASKREFSMFKGYGLYDWVLPVYRYAGPSTLLTELKEKVIKPATLKASELAERKEQL